MSRRGRVYNRTTHRLREIERIVRHCGQREILHRQVEERGKISQDHRVGVEIDDAREAPE